MKMKESSAMLFREGTEGRIAISQPAHAWISGQLARSWGNELFGDVEPWEEVCLGAEQHDVGHSEWEQAPTLNPQTSLPYSFFDMPTQLHVGLWSKAARLVLPQGRYPALLVSLHGTGLYEKYHDVTKDTPADAQAVQSYLTNEYAFQQELLASLRADPYYAVYATEELVAHNRRLIGVWDAFSLAVCFGRERMQPLQNVPTATGVTTLALQARDGDPTQIVVSPWPFRRDHVTLVYEGRYLNETFANEKTMRAALQRAPWVTLRTTLAPH
jgi:hypothetical protein